MMKRTFFTLIIFSFSLLCSYAQTNEQTDSVPDIQAAIRAANEGDVSAQCFLGIVYSVGQYNVEQNYTEAIKWFTMAAEKGEPTAQYNLSLFYIEGFGVEPDTVQAQKWYDLAFQQDNTLPPLIVERPAPNDIDLTIATKKKGKMVRKSHPRPKRNSPMPFRLSVPVLKLVMLLLSTISESFTMMELALSATTKKPSNGSVWQLSKAMPMHKTASALCTMRVRA